MADFTPLKERISADLVSQIADLIGNSSAAFNRESFTAAACLDLEQLGLMERCLQITQSLRQHLPTSYTEAVKLLTATLPKEPPQESFYLFMPYARFVQEYGLQDWDASFEAMAKITPHSTAEWALRPFLKADQERAFSYLTRWVDAESVDLRRLASEGSRPRLPWAGVLPRLTNNPSAALNLLEFLRDDQSRYVQRSVANHLNDITKDNPEAVLATLKRWLTEPTPQRTWIANHALRSLIKQGHPEALELLGFKQNPAVLLTNFKIEPATISIGESLKLSFTVESQALSEQHLMIDFTVGFMKANGQLSPKVFKLRRLLLEPNQQLHLGKNFHFAQRTTRKLYPGKHQISVQINGKTLTTGSFNLIKS